jgi:hypothetical protein
VLLALLLATTALRHEVKAQELPWYVNTYALLLLDAEGAVLSMPSYQVIKVTEGPFTFQAALDRARAISSGGGLQYGKIFVPTHRVQQSFATQTP